MAVHNSSRGLGLACKRFVLETVHSEVNFPEVAIEIKANARETRKSIPSFVKESLCVRVYYIGREIHSNILNQRIGVVVVCQRRVIQKALANISRLIPGIKVAKNPSD